MHGLEQGINQLANYEMNAKVRSNAILQLNGIIDDLNSAIDVWDGYLKSGNKNSDSGAYGGWAGFNIEKKLFELDLKAREKAREASSGKSSLDDPVVVLAYSMLGDSETVSDRCSSAIEEIRNRISKVNELIETIKSTKPKKTVSAGASKQTSAKVPAKATGKKKSKKKKTAKKKLAKKKPAAKKAKKKTTKSKTKKKAAKKKAAKKSSKKKTAKKKTSKKKAGKKKVKKTKAKKKAKKK